jgi:CheY-like chemotaxis protein
VIQDAQSQYPCPSARGVQTLSRILIVEDNGAVREVLEETFCREGILAVTANDGEEAYERLRAEGPFDAVILDLILPGDKDGYSVCREIRAGMGGRRTGTYP